MLVANCLSGMFLWVRLVMKSLNECDSEDELLKAMDTLPKGLNQALACPSILQSKFSLTVAQVWSNS
jgi:hypothetical protein